MWQPPTNPPARADKQFSKPVIVLRKSGRVQVMHVRYVATLDGRYAPVKWANRKYDYSAADIVAWHALPPITATSLPDMSASDLGDILAAVAEQ